MMGMPSVAMVAIIYNKGRQVLKHIIQGRQPRDGARKRLSLLCPWETNFFPLLSLLPPLLLYLHMESALTFVCYSLS